MFLDSFPSFLIVVNMSLANRIIKKRGGNRSRTQDPNQDHGIRESHMFLSIEEQTRLRECCDVRIARARRPIAQEYMKCTHTTLVAAKNVCCVFVGVFLSVSGVFVKRV